MSEYSERSTPTTIRYRRIRCVPVMVRSPCIARARSCERPRTVRLSRACEPCKSREVGRQTREQAAELRAVAPLVVLGAQPTLIGPCTLVSNGVKTVAFSSAELLRKAGEPLAVALSPDASKS